MDPKPKNLESVDSDQDDQIIDGFTGLTAAVLSQEYFSPFEVKFSESSPHTISLTSEDVTSILLSPNIWQDQKKLEPYINPNNNEEFIVICVGDPSQEEAMDRLAHEHAFQTICLPITLWHLKSSIQNYLKLQQKILNSEQSRKLVEDTSESIKYVLRVSRELNGIRDTNKLLSLILMKAREISNADAGSIYVVQWQDPSKTSIADSPGASGTINFKITQNETVHLNLSEFEVPISETSIVGNAVIHEKSININDLYKLDPDRTKNPYNAQHDRSWDEKIGYQCRSMLTVPMFDISNRVIGVIQLINRKRKKTMALKEISDFDDKVVPFQKNDVEYAEIIAHQAGIALENALLTEERKQLFEGFVHASVTAIEQRDPTTSGHSHRVAKLTLETAKLVDKVSVGPYSNIFFDEDSLKEIEYASLLHDFGKLGVREEVLVKAKKLYPLERELILEKFDHVRSRYELEYANEVIEYLKNPDTFPPGFGPAVLEAKRDQKMQVLQEYLDFVNKSNEPTVLEQGGFEKLKDIANIKFQNSARETKSLLRTHELKALSVSRGSLTREEFAEIQSHVTHTYEFLRKIPWGQKFSNVPQIAAKHHEKLDGSGYPTSAYGGEIPIQSRIMTIADIFDALTASDRPYKKAVPTLKALDIIDMEVKSGKLDAELFNIFLESKIYECVL